MVLFSRCTVVPRHHASPPPSFQFSGRLSRRFLPLILHRSDLARHTREESVCTHPLTPNKLASAPPRVRARVHCSGRFPFTPSLEWKRALCGSALNLLESALAKNRPNSGGGGVYLLTSRPATTVVRLRREVLQSFANLWATTKKRAAPVRAAPCRPNHQDGGSVAAATRECSSGRK